MRERELGIEDPKIFYEMINRMTKLSPDTYVLLTDVVQDLTYVPENTAEFFGMKTCWCKDCYHKLLEYVHPYDRPEYREELKLRFHGQKLSDELYIRMGKEDHYCLMRIMVDVIEKEGQPRYFVVLLRNQNVCASVDPRTDLYGQAKFEQDIAGYIHSGRSVVVLEIAIDHMTDINILYGANYSDRIHRVLAYRLIYMMDENKAVYHMDNSNYAFILKDADRAEAEAFFKLLRTSIEHSVSIGENQFELKTYAAGMELDHYDGETSTVQSKLEYVLEKMRLCRNHSLMFFNDLVQINGDVNLDLMKVIHQSVLNECDGFYLEYQPIVEAETGQIKGVEALVRWQKEPYGKVPPGMFIDWLEGNPCMYDLGAFVLKRALTDGVKFREENPCFFVNVNISAKQLERPTFREMVVELLQETGFPADHLCLELTERCRNLPVEKMCEEIVYLKQYGIRFAMDDYGTGSASSSIVLHTPMDEIKIDMSFVRGIMDDQKKQALVRSMITFANDIQLKSCIEGVEDEALQDYLREFGSTWFQGYYYSKPVCAKKILELLQEKN